MKTRTSKIVYFLWSSVLLFATSVMAASFAGYVWNTSASVPVGLWRVHHQDGPYERGQTVLLCPPDTELFRAARAVGIVPKGRCPGNFEPLLKPVAAIARDRVSVSSRGLKINGQLIPNSIPIKRLGAKKLISTPYPSGTYQVPPGEVWLVSTHSRSWDSRYFGPISSTLIKGVAQPKWLVNGDKP